MSSEPTSRAEREERILRAIRAMTAHSSLLSQAIADQLGLHASDLECLGILADEGPCTAGRIGELTGLTSGAVTRLVDRLEQGGWVRRGPDASDRRRVVVEAVAEKRALLAPYYEDLVRASREANARYSDDELGLVTRFLEEGSAQLKAQLERVRQGGRPLGPGEYSAPLAGLTRGRLVFRSGISQVQLRAEESPELLFHAKFDGPQPTVKTRDGSVTIEYARLSVVEWARLALSGKGHVADVALSTQVRWALDVRGGLSSVEADLTRLRLDSLEFAGGASQLVVKLPAPEGVVPVRISGGVSDIAVWRPPGTAARVTAAGGVSGYTLDGQHRGSTGGTLRWDSGHADAPDRYELEFSGGVSNFELGVR